MTQSERDKRNKIILDFVKEHSDEDYIDISYLLKSETGIDLNYTTVQQICLQLGYRKPHSYHGHVSKSQALKETTDE